MRTFQLIATIAMTGDLITSQRGTAAEIMPRVPNESYARLKCEEMLTLCERTFETQNESYDAEDGTQIDVEVRELTPIRLSPRLTHALQSYHRGQGTAIYRWMSNMDSTGFAPLFRLIDALGDLQLHNEHEGKLYKNITQVVTDLTNG